MTHPLLFVGVEYINADSLKLQINFGDFIQFRKFAQ